MPARPTSPRNHRRRISPVMSVIVASVLAVGCGGAGKSARAPRAAHVACIGGVCLHPDHVVAQRVLDGPRKRCVVLAWEGDDARPPTPSTTAMMTGDAESARPGLVAAIDIPSFYAGGVFPIAGDLLTAGVSAASVFTLRVDPGAHFADQRVVEAGAVEVRRSGDDGAVLVRARGGDGKPTTATFIVSRSHNGCISRS